MTERKRYLNAKDFELGLAALDSEMSRSEWLVAFAPIRLIAAGGFLAVSYLKNRETTGDLDYLIDPEFDGDDDIQRPLHEAVQSVADQLEFNDEWFNEAMSVFVTKKTRNTLFEKAEQQGIILFKGENLEIMAAPIEWALERKLRRMHCANRGRKTDLDLSDAIALLKRMKEQNNGPLDSELIRRMNLNGFDVIPDHGTMQRVANAYKEKYNEEVFS
ncbi:hypothetical protein BJX99DRAFT_69591 [Aspergillus californicus]